MGELEPGIKNARYYHTARTAHIERLAAMVPADFLYTTTRADWDELKASTTPRVEHVKPLQVVGRILLGRYTLIEVPELLALPLLPQLLAIAVASKICRWRGRSVGLVMYAIENLDPVAKAATRLPLPRPLIRWMLRASWGVILAEVSRISFGTDGARDTYVEAIGRSRWERYVGRIESKLFLALPQAAEVSIEKFNGSVCFLGTFEDRKGVRELLSAWPDIVRLRPSATLTIMGKGELAPEVRVFASTRPEVALVEDPSREQIRLILAAQTVLVLLSKTTPTWREQVGLPIIEGLEFGCRIVTSKETGIADWLEAHDHGVLDDLSREAVSIAIIKQMHLPAGAATTASLPSVDSRIEADRWMFGA